MVLVEVARDLGAGTCGGCAGIVTGQPLDTIKVRLQSRPEHFQGIADCALRTVRHEGVRGLFKGLVPPLIGNAPLNALLFATNAASVRAVCDLRDLPEEKLSDLDKYACGCVAGFSASIVMCPTELIKCQLQVQMSKANPLFVGIGGCVRAMHQEAGLFRGVFRGFTLTAMRDTPSFGIYFLVYDRMKTLWEAVLPETPATLMAGGLAGMACWAGIYPIDVVKSCVQALPPSATLAERRMLTVAGEMYRTGGLRPFTRGFAATMCRAFPVNAVTFAGYEATLSAMDAVGFVEEKD
jgi:solute carrier family 25 carnitine/acylcarnitine transporter 20/29